MKKAQKAFYLIAKSGYQTFLLISIYNGDLQLDELSSVYIQNTFFFFFFFKLIHFDNTKPNLNFEKSI